jgi:hypothetical protein
MEGRDYCFDLQRKEEGGGENRDVVNYKTFRFIDRFADEI